MLSTTLSVVLGDGSPRKQTHLVSIWEEEEEDENGGSDGSSLGIWGGLSLAVMLSEANIELPLPPPPGKKQTPS